MGFNKELALAILLSLLLTFQKSFAQVSYQTFTLSDSIGSSIMNPPDEAFLLESPRSVAFDSGGYVYILDTGRFSVLKFDPHLQLVDKVGRRGKGPMEFSFNNRARNEGHLCVGLTDEVLVFELDNARAQLISNDLKSLIKNYRFHNFVYNITIGKNGRIYTMSQNIEQKTLVNMYDDEGYYIESFDRMFVVDPPQQYTSTFNNSELAVNRFGEVMAVNTLTPIIRIFDWMGNLKIEKELDLGEVVLDKNFRKYYYSNPNVREFSNRKLRNNEIVQFLTKKVCSDGEDFYLLLMFDTIVKVSREGEITYIIDLDFRQYSHSKYCFGLDFDVMKNRIIMVTTNSLGLLFTK